MGAVLRTGGHIGRGAPPYPTMWATPELEASILRKANRELALEAGRRDHAPTVPSRLSCLWLAEDTVKGRAWVQREIVGPRSFIMQVRVTIERESCRCDAHWLDRVHADPDDAEAVAGYWSGTPIGNDPLWEYLLQGQISAGDPDELQRLRDFIHNVGPPGARR